MVFFHIRFVDESKALIGIPTIRFRFLKQEDGYVRSYASILWFVFAIVFHVFWKEHPVSVVYEF
jgi:hypothetical protein